MVLSLSGGAEVCHHSTIHTTYIDTNLDHFEDLQGQITKGTTHHLYISRTFDKALGLFFEPRCNLAGFRVLARLTPTQHLRIQLVPIS